ncbi:MAG: hypothetical protein O3A46_07765, partial [Candidatus Poribacteria bacterium]|nr:hypothetical protein [Candidatus Poribacteria bacterium]
EPYARDLSQAWHDRITDFVVDAEREFERKHLISWNVANHKGKVEKPHPGISIFNFHYASPPIPIEENAHLNRPIGDNETGFNKGRDTHYRMEGWEFLLAGGALYNNLDYSFTVGHEDGSYAYPDSQPGGGSAELRRSLRTLKEFIESFEFLKMSPDRFAIQKLAPEGARATTLSQPGMQYASYIYGGGQTTLTMSLTNGSYNVEWLDVMNGNTIKRERIDTDGSITLVSPDYKTDIALRIRRA